MKCHFISFKFNYKTDNKQKSYSQLDLFNQP